MLLDAFLEQCQSRPNAIALSEGDRQISFGELLNKARAVAASLSARGIGVGQAVAVFIDRGIDATAAVFGILLAGACYVPLDVKNPPQRLSFIVEDAAAKAVLGVGLPPSWLATGLWLALEDCALGQAPKVDISADALAAVLYTSGSTGQPRGVALSHGAIVAFAAWVADLLALTADDRIASSTPFFFDLSTFDLYAALGAGASVHFVPPMLTMAPAHLSAWLQDQAISGWYTVPSLLAFLAYKGNLPQTPLPRLRFLLFAGEVFPLPALTALAAALPDTALYNFFGPTETNVCCYWQVERETLSRYRNIPIGGPAAGCEFRIEQSNRELWVRGPTLAVGYWREGGLKPILNAQGWYATGDRVSLEDGLYHFHGRIGRMLKCSGYRVEPAEIEAVVNNLPGVKDCAVIGLDDSGAGQRPALALTLSSEGAVANVRKQIGQILPAYMHPVRYLVLDSLPRLSNGKLDYQALIARFERPAGK
jgi:amino acid adenylation domain-containing protein